MIKKIIKWIRYYPGKFIFGHLKSARGETYDNFKNRREYMLMHALRRKFAYMRQAEYDAIPSKNNYAIRLGNANMAIMEASLRKFKNLGMIYYPSLKQIEFVNLTQPGETHRKY